MDYPDIGTCGDILMDLNREEDETMDIKIIDSLPVTEKAATKRARKKKANIQNNSMHLIAALKFISAAQKKVGTVQQQFCAISGNWIVASNETLTIGSKIPEDLIACPHSYQLLDALQKCGPELNITQLTENTLSIKSGDFRALIPCVNFAELQLSGPDPETVKIDNKVQKALDAVMPLATEGGKFAYLAGVLLKSGSAVSTNGSAILECWHGAQLPGQYLIPKASAAAIGKCDKTLTGFGCSPNSITFYYEDESFIKAQLFAEEFVNYEPLFKQDINVWQLPEEFFKAVHAVESFNNSNTIFFKEGAIASSNTPELATTYKVEGLPEGMAFNSKFLTMLEHAIEKVCFDKESDSMYFFKDNMRGILKSMRIHEEAIDSQEPKPLPTYEDQMTSYRQKLASGELTPEDIPF